MHKIWIGLLVALVIGCATKSSRFIKSGYDTYAPKPEDYEVKVIEKGEQPDHEYAIIGLVVAEGKSDLLFSSKLTRQDILELLKKEAKKHGADAIMDIKMTSAASVHTEPESWPDVQVVKRSEAKAIVFK